MDIAHKSDGGGDSSYILLVNEELFDLEAEDVDDEFIEQLARSCLLQVLF